MGAWPSHPVQPRRGLGRGVGARLSLRRVRRRGAADTGLRDRRLPSWRDPDAPSDRRVLDPRRYAPGDVSLLTRAAESHWVWPEEIEVVHVYLTHDELTATCRQMYEREVEDVESPRRGQGGRPGDLRDGDAHRRGSHAGGRGEQAPRGLAFLPAGRAHPAPSCARAVPRAGRQRRPDVPPGTRRSATTSTSTCGENITLDDLAGSVALSRFHFARMFRSRRGQAPHAFVLQQRLARARALLSRTERAAPRRRAQRGFSGPEPYEPGVRQADRDHPRSVPRLTLARRRRARHAVQVCRKAAFFADMSARNMGCRSIEGEYLPGRDLAT